MGALDPVLKTQEFMRRNENTYKFILKISSIEVKFTKFKQNVHPDTKMAKASLNMVTQTFDPDYAKLNILMNSLDTGWVSEMVPEDLLKGKRTVLLDELDGTMRVLHTIMRVTNKGEIQYSLFLKDYKPNKW